MTTSLAEQLQRLAVPQTSILKRDKKRASILFSPKDAAGLKRETVYQIGVEGLEELIAKKENFNQFRESLFSYTSKDFERAVQDRNANDKLNKKIKQFLLHLSPYFILSCSHKALEWLVHRYMINEYNRNDLLLLILPYHESNIFVRILQVVQFKDHNDCWYFLKTLQKSGVHLPKLSLLNHAASNVGFLSMVSTYISDLIKENPNSSTLTVAFNFYCSVFTGAIEYSKEVTEAHVTQILPCLIKGLNSSIMDFCAASYVITARLVAKISMSDMLLNKVVEKISEMRVMGLRTEATLVLLVIYQSQKQYTSIPEYALQCFAKSDWIPMALQELNSSGSFIYPFLEVLVRRCTENGTNSENTLSREFLKKLLQHIKMDDSYVGKFVHAWLGGLHRKLKYSPQVFEWLCSIIQTLENQYPDAFDREVLSIFSTSGDKLLRKKKKCLETILKNTMALKGKLEVFQKLNHFNPQYREQAVKFLMDNYVTLVERDKDMVVNLILNRLNDENIMVVKEILSLILKVTVLDASKFKHCLLALASKCKTNKEVWGLITNQVLKTLLSSSIPIDWEVMLGIFPYLLPNNSGELKSAKKLLKYSKLRNHVFFKENVEKLEEIRDHREFTNYILQCLQENGDLETVKDFVELLRNLKTESVTYLQRYIAAVMLSNILPQNSSLQISSFVLQILIMFYKSSSVKSVKKKSLVTSYIESACKEKFPVPGFLQCLNNIILKTRVGEDKLSMLDFEISNEQTHFFAEITNILVSVIYKKYFHSFLGHFCTCLEDKIEFLLNLCSSKHPGLNEGFVKNSLVAIEMLLNNADTNLVKSYVNFDRLVVPYILPLLHNPDVNVRHAVFKILLILMQASPKKTDSYSLLIVFLLKHKDDIILDGNQVPLMASNLLGNAKANKNHKYLNYIRYRLAKIAGDKTYPVYIQSGILDILTKVNSFEMFEETSKLPTEILAGKPQVIEGSKGTIIARNIARFDTTVASRIMFSLNAGRLLEALVKNDFSQVLVDGKSNCPSVMLLTQLKKEVFTELKEDVRNQLLDMIIEVSATAQNAEVLPAASRFFKHIDLNANLITEHLIKMRDVKSPKQKPTKAKRRISVVPTIDILDTLQWKKGQAVLEFLQDKKKLRNTESILPLLFDVLKKCLDFDEQAAVEYPKQLILSLILHCCGKTEDDKLPESVFNMELIVQCIRASPNPQTHHHALLLLAHTASFLPNQVLHHIMAIFTFMGSSVLRHDDAYSFQILTKIINTIIPILITDNQVKNIVTVLRVFVDALLDVPEHRRLPLYKLLLTNISAKENLYLFLLLVFDSHVIHNAHQKQRVSKGVVVDNNPKRLDIAANLSREFEPEIVFYTSIQLIKYLKELPDEKETEIELKTFNISHQTAKQFRHYKYTLLTFTSSLLSSKEFVNQVAQLSDNEVTNLESLYKDMIINILTYIQRISKVTDKNLNTTHAQYWKVVLHHSYDILDSLNALLTPQMFLLVTKGLMVHNLSTVRRRILELLNSKLQHDISFFEECDKSELCALVPPIISIVEGINNSPLEPEQEVIIQTALLSLKLLVRLLVDDNIEKFIKILDFITNIIMTGKAQNNLLASLVLCLAELCVNLRAHAISSLPNYMPAILKILRQQRNQESSILVLLSIVTALQKILENLPLFLSPYLEKLLCEIALLISRFGESSTDQKVQPLINKLTNIKEKIGTVIPARVLIPIIEKCYSSLIEKSCFNAVSVLMDILAETLSNMKGPEITSNLPEFTTFFLNALQFRADDKSTVEEANMVEGHVIKALTTLILKLSEGSFRPLYYRLFDWAVRSEIKNERVITFYSLSNSIAHSLKGLFVLFAGHFLNNSAQILDSCNQLKNETLYFEDEQKVLLLLQNVLKTLNAVFLYDNQKFINKDRFDVLMQPIVDQLENTLGGEQNLVERNKVLLTPCIVQFALATADDALWKQMNYQILLKMRHTSSNIRLVALHCLTELVKKLGEDFLPLLPETIPFLAELLEDEDENVEKACQKAVQEMEKVLGEPLQKYF